MVDHVRLPNARETLLVRAALAPPAEAVAAWGAWRAAGEEIDHVEGPQYALLPLVARNLREAAAGDPSLARLHGLYRRTWYRNRLILGRLEQVVATLQAAGIEPMLLKGTAMIAGHAAEPGAWHMNDMDILVPRAQLRHAAERLMAAGWTRTGDAPPFSGQLAFSRSVALQNSGFDLDVHGSSHLHEHDADDGLWARATRAPLGAGEVFVPAPEDLLVGVLAHAFRWHNWMSLRWTADAAWLLRRYPSIDWEIVVHEGRRRLVGPEMARALAYLAANLGTPVNEPALTTLSRPPRLPLDYRLAQRTTRWRSRSGYRWGKDITIFIQATHEWPLPRRLAALPRLVAYSWRLDSPRDIPAVALRKLRKTAAAAVGLRPRQAYGYRGGRAGRGHSRPEL